MKPQVSNAIAIISTVLITGALGLVGGKVYLQLQDKSLPDGLNTLFWLASIALIAHGIQGAIAAIKANSSNLNPVTYGIYTFFVGTVGLLRLSEANSKPSDQ